jgi:hypothetical protein
MSRLLVASGALVMALASPAHAEQSVSCKGSITSKQGEGLVVRTFRFEVDAVTGSDLKEVMERVRVIARQRQNKAGRANPAQGFRRFSEIDLDCSRGVERFQVRRTLQTSP